MLPRAQRFLERAQHQKARFLANLRRGRELQRDLLQRMIAVNADTAFGREHGFASIKNLDDYRRAVPLRRYDDLRPYIDRTLAGESRVLTVADPIMYFATTGTTGAPKRVPVTREAFGYLANNQLVYWASLAERYPAVIEDPDTVVMLHLAPKPFGELSQTGVPVLNPTHLPADGNGAFPYSWSSWYPPPPELNDRDRLYYFLRRTIERRLAGFVCLHPSRMPAFAARLALDAPRLVQELHDGTNGDANPTRARELEAIMRDGTLEPHHVWPQLGFVACWYGGSFKLFRPRLEELYKADVIPHMSASSEAGHITLPVDGAELDGPLTLHANHYEFIPADADDEHTLTYEELELGRSYQLVITSPSGLYRYVSGDCFEVQGFVEGVPRVGFLGRGGVVDMTGEKISEQQVQAAIDRSLAALELRAAGATSCAVLDTRARYVFIFEPLGRWDAAQIEDVARRIDIELQALNSRYKLKRDFGDLHPAEVCIAPAGAFERSRAALIARGAPATQLKDKVLHTDRAVLTALTT